MKTSDVMHVHPQGDPDRHLVPPTSGNDRFSMKPRGAFGSTKTSQPFAFQMMNELRSFNVFVRLSHTQSSCSSNKLALILVGKKPGPIEKNGISADVLLSLRGTSSSRLRQVEAGGA